jgi:thiosulfate/3-mercaptopyruvate sulfurtransferase
MSLFLKRNLTPFVVFFMLFAWTAIPVSGQTNDLWKADQLMEPQVLFNMINSAKGNNAPVILNIGSVGNIKGAIDLGPASEADGIAGLKKQLKNIPKNKMVVIYCGCCPLFKCPNVRPAFKLLTAAGYTNINVLNLKTNLKTDWIDKKFPMDDDK